MKTVSVKLVVVTILLLAVLMPGVGTAQADDIIITGILDGDLTGGLPKAIELYIWGTVDLSDYTLERAANGGAFGSARTLSGTYTDEFVYLVYSTGVTEFIAVFGESGDYANRIELGTVSGNGDDAFRIILTATSTVIDQVWYENTTDSYRDSYWYRNNETGPDGGWVETNWTAGGNDALDGLDAAGIRAAVPFGSYSAPTAVELAAFSAAADGDSIQVQWETATELDNLGFNLYRASAAVDAPRIKLNANLIPAANPGSAAGAAYQFADRAADAGVTYYYWLEDVDVYGRATLHGPVEARLDALRRLLPVRPRLAPALPIHTRR